VHDGRPAPSKGSPSTLAPSTPASEDRFVSQLPTSLARRAASVPRASPRPAILVQHRPQLPTLNTYPGRSKPHLSIHQPTSRQDNRQYSQQHTQRANGVGSQESDDTENGHHHQQQQQQSVSPSIEPEFITTAAHNNTDFLISHAVGHQPASPTATDSYNMQLVPTSPCDLLSQPSQPDDQLATFDSPLPFLATSPSFEEQIGRVEGTRGDWDAISGSDICKSIATSSLFLASR
jgi:hypothetical protein